MSRTDGNFFKGCIISCVAGLIVWIILGCIWGMILLNYVLDTVVGRTVEGPIATVISLFITEVTLPLAAICWLIRAVGIAHPLVHLAH
jgi:hypothetical protein